MGPLEMIWKASPAPGKANFVFRIATRDGHFIDELMIWMERENPNASLLGT
jgi:hypothetical protein